MAESIGSVKYDLDLDDDEFNKGLSDASKNVKGFADKSQFSLQKVGDSMKRVGKTMTTFVTLPLAAFGAVAIKEAAAAEGAMAKFNTVFGEGKDEMISFIDELRKTMPTARQDIITLAAGLQDLLVPLGLTRQKAMEMSQGFLDVSNKIAAFNDVSPAAVLESIRAGLVGSSEPLAKFGTDARVTALETVALEAGLLKAGQAFKDLEPTVLSQVRAEALLLQITKQNSDAINGFTENNDSALRRAQDLQASLKELSAAFGTILLPALDSLNKEVLTPLVAKFKELDEEQQKQVSIALLIAGAIGPLALAMAGLIKLFAALKIVVAATGTALAVLSAPLTVLIGLIIALGLIVMENKDLIIEALTITRDNFMMTFGIIKKLLFDFGAQVKKNFLFAKKIITEFVQFLFSFYVARFSTAIEITRDVLSAIVEDFKILMDLSKTVWGAMVDDLKIVTRAFTSGWEVIRDKFVKPFKDALDGLKGKLASFGISSVIDFVGGRAEGGPMMAGQTAIVGEHGPEVFTAKTSGNIIPNDQLGGGVTVNIGTANIRDEQDMSRIGREVGFRVHLNPRFQEAL